MILLKTLLEGNLTQLDDWELSRELVKAPEDMEGSPDLDVYYLYNAMAGVYLLVEDDYSVALHVGQPSDPIPFVRCIHTNNPVEVDAFLGMMLGVGLMYETFPVTSPGPVYVLRAFDYYAHVLKGARQLILRSSLGFEAPMPQGWRIRRYDNLIILHNDDQSAVVRIDQSDSQVLCSLVDLDLEDFMVCIETSGGIPEDKTLTQNSYASMAAADTFLKELMHNASSGQLDLRIWNRSTK